MEEDKDKQIVELRRRLKEKMKVCYIKDGQLTEKDIQIQDLEEEKEGAEAQVKRLEVNGQGRILLNEVIQGTYKVGHAYRRTRISCNLAKHQINTVCMSRKPVDYYLMYHFTCSTVN